MIKAYPEVTDLREDENSLTEIWYQIHEKGLKRPATLQMEMCDRICETIFRRRLRSTSG